MKNVAWKLVPSNFSFSKNPLQKEIWGGMYADFEEFLQFCYYISNISMLLQKFHFPIEVVVNSLQTQKGLELFFRLQFL